MIATVPECFVRRSIQDLLRSSRIARHSRSDRRVRSQLAAPVLLKWRSTLVAGIVSGCDARRRGSFPHLQ